MRERHQRQIDESVFEEVNMMLELLKARFSEHKELHPDLEWSEVERRLREAPAAIAVLQRMEESGGEPDTIGYDTKTRKLLFLRLRKGIARRAQKPVL